ncbi:MAG: hypothetical protein E7418_04310 [Ruminococcaceae bacterium]|nr:hypothetical protein [Oscillospiraceae bacterium]
MIINLNRTVAYRCASCGEICFGNFSLFELSGNKGVSVQCKCGQSELRVESENKAGYIISVKCLVCDEIHKFSLPFLSLAKKDCTEYSCPNVMVGLVFIGREEGVQSAVVRNESYIDEVVSACGLDHTGKNGVTMLKALDKIQELSDDEALYCDCGSNMIDVEVRENDLILECCMCGASITLTADAIRNSDFSRLQKLVLKSKR